MKNFYILFCFITALTFISACGKSGSDSVPGDGYGIDSGGAVIRSAPEEGSGRLGVVPPGAHVKVSGRSPESGDASWYKAEWNGVQGWVRAGSISDISGFLSYLGETFRSDEQFVKQEFRGRFDFKKQDGIKRYFYSGGEMETSSMTILPSGGMVLNSQIFSEKPENRYFVCEFQNDGALLKIIFADNRASLSDYVAAENGSSSVFKIDRNEGSITYHVRDGSFFFMNWGFFPETEN